MKRPKSISEIPNGEHYAIITFASVYHEGDERSRTHPGHGYPAYTEQVPEFMIFGSKEDWEAEIIKRMNSKFAKQDFKAVKITPAEISTTIQVEIK